MAQTQSRRTALWHVLLLSALGTSGTAAHALEPATGWHLHGFGNVDRADRPAADDAPARTDYQFAFVNAVRLGDREEVWFSVSQVHEKRGTFSQIDWAFFEWNLTPTSTWRFGQLRAPLGLLNEMRGVQASRPSSSLPLLYDEHLGLTSGTLRGIAYENRGDTVTVDAYAAFAAHTHEGAQKARRLGGRISWDTPVPGVKLIGSAYAGRGMPEHHEDEPMADALDDHSMQREQALMVSLIATQGAWELGAEAAAARIGEHHLQLAYVQLAYRWSHGLTPFVRAEMVVTDTSMPHQTDTHQHRLAAGLAWQPSPNWGLRAEWARNRGAAAAVAAGLAEPADAKPRWQEVLLSANYSF